LKNNEKYRLSEFKVMGRKVQTLLVSRLLFSANLLAFSLLGGSQAASKSSKLSRKLLSERCFAVLVCLFFTKARQKTQECFRIARLFNAELVKKRRPKPKRFEPFYP